MRSTILSVFLILTLVVALSGTAFAHPDDPPSIKLTATDSRGFVLGEFDKVAYVLAEAEDEGFNAGVSSVQLMEGSRVIERKECFFTLKCELRVPIVENTSRIRTFKGVVIDAGQSKKSATISVRFLGVERAPTLSFMDDVEVREGNAINIPIGVYDRNNDNATVTAKKLPKGATFLGNKFSWTPGFDQSGDYVIVFTAADNDGSVEKSLHIKVIENNRAPAVNFTDKSASIFMQEGRKETFGVTVKDPDGKEVPVEWKLNGRTISTSKQYTFKPNFDAAGFYLLSAVVKDKSFVTQKSWNISVENVNRKPVLNTIQEKEINEGDTLRFYVHGKDDDRSELKFTARDLPRGATFDAETRRFEWKTHEGDAGKYTPVFRVSDGRDSDARTVKITIKRKFLTSHEKYHEFLERIEREKREKIAQNMEIAQMQKNITKVECKEGYLCSTTVFFA